MVWPNDLNKIFKQKKYSLCKNIDETGAFSYHKDIINGHNYATSIKYEQYIIEVDRIWRVACAIHAFPFISENRRLMIHCYNRKHYRKLLKIYQQESTVDSLAIMKPLKKTFLNYTWKKCF